MHNGRAHLLPGVSGIDYRSKTDKGDNCALTVKKPAVRWSGGYVPINTHRGTAAMIV